MTFAPFILMLAVCLPPADAPAPDSGTDPAKEIVALEKAMLDRWSTGDTYAFIDIAAPDITYFDPGLEKRLDGAEAFEKFLGPLKGTFRVFRYEMIDPKVQAHGEVAVLTYNLIDYDDTGKATERWNTSEVYHRLDGQWRLIHSHFSLTKPKAK